MEKRKLEFDKKSGQEAGLKIALVPAAICWKDKDKNITKLAIPMRKAISSREYSKSIDAF
jgi:hypothetical protein